MRTRRKHYWLSAVVVALALVASACGDDDDTGASPTTTAGTNTTSGSNGSGSEPATGEPIKLGLVLTIQSPAWNNDPVREAAEMWAEYINTELNGVNGRPLELETCDDEGDPAKSAQCVADLEEKGVVALLGVSSLGFGASGVPAIEQAGLAQIGGWPISAAEYFSPNEFPIHPGAAGSYPVLGVYYRSIGCESAVFLLQNNAAAQAAGQAALDVWLSLGGTGELKSFDPAAPDYTPAMADIASGDFECLVFGSGASQLVRLIEAAEVVGLDMPMGTTGTAATAENLAALGSLLDNVVFATPVMPYNANHADIKLFEEVASEYGPTIAYTSQTATGVASVAYTYHVLGQIEGEITRATVLERLSAGGDWDGFLVHPLSKASASADAPQLWNPYSALAQAEGDKLVAFDVGDYNTDFSDFISESSGLTWFRGNLPG